jgi:putative two-component system response regulator
VKERRGADGAGERVLVVDDDDAVARLTARVLGNGGFACDIAGDATGARAELARRPYALLLCDMGLPGESGLDLARDVRYRYPETATVFITGMDDRVLAEEALALGAYGYVIKPFRANELLINVANALRRRLLELESRRRREHLEHAVAERTRALRVSQEETIALLSSAAEARDDETGSHIRRMAAYCELLARYVGLDPERCELIRLAAPLHDVGKISVADSVLRKPGALTADERTEIDRHTLVGYELLRGHASPLLELAATIALTHHERIDGRGKPYGLAAAEIPLEGRIAAVADVFDALTSDRCYRPALPLEAALAELRAAAGSHLDARLVELLVANVAEFLTVGRLVDGARREAAA